MRSASVSLEAVVFDLDDTLFAERQYVLSGFRAVAAWLDDRHGVSEGPAFSELRDLFESGVRLNTFDEWLTGRSLGDAIAAGEMVEVYRNHVPAISPAPGIHELLERLGHRFRLGLVSDGYAWVQRTKFEALGLARHFEAVVFSDELGREHWKPSPRPFEVVTELLGVAAADSVYVADNPTKDFIGARSIGMATVRLRRPEGVYALAEPPSAAHAPDFEVIETAAIGPLLEDKSGGPGLRQVGESNYTPRTIASADRPTNV
jgi:putative hydrolase of the HAD superfamily